ncbi:MAG TPA: ATP-binding cassette domain-containing protein [Conexibacter sp.]|nr:ATP-binding cassette domain-containing protein [Conexibacter sp.]
MTVLSLADVTRRVRAGRETAALLDAVALDVWPGEHVAILGARRQGKTTLLRIAAGIESPDAGVVRLDGDDLGALPRGTRTRRLRAVGYVPKEWRVARGKPALDHVALPLLAEGRPLVTALAKAHEALERVGATHCAGSSTDELAPVDATRVALAQALVRRPRLLLVDEPGAAAEPDEREELLRLLRTIAGEQPELALVVTSRDVAGVAGATRVLTLGDGALRGASRPDDAEVLPFPTRDRPGERARDHAPIA